MNAGVLYVVGTPIGNLKDISIRALETLKIVDFIAAEDTRIILKLLNYYNIKNKIISYHQHSSNDKINYIINKILSGETCALVSDAGMPCISDPGEILISLAIKSNILIKVIPGPSALISALSISGLPTSNFSFEGFLSNNNKHRIQHLKRLINDKRTLIFYESPHRLKNTLSDILFVFGIRRISIIKELTKIHESSKLMTTDEAVNYYNVIDKIKGEYVIILEGSIYTTAEDKISIEEAVSMIKDLKINSNIPLSQASKIIAIKTGYKKSLLYKLSIDLS